MNLRLELLQSRVHIVADIATTIAEQGGSIYPWRSFVAKIVPMSIRKLKNPTSSPD